MKIETPDGSSVYLSLSDLSTWERNYRKGDIDAIEKSISRFGFNGALSVRKGVVMAGNHSLLALRRLEEKGAPLPKHIIAEPSGGWLIPCIDISHLSEDEAEAYAIADNRTQELGTCDDSALLAVLSDLARSEIDLLDCAGYSAESIDALAGPTEPNLEPRERSNRPKKEVICPSCGETFEL